MKNKTISLISSPLLRPNGISRFISGMIIEGYTDNLVLTDSRVEYDKFPFKYESNSLLLSEYSPSMKTSIRPNGTSETHVWLHVDETIVDNLVEVLERYSPKYIYCHCALSALACKKYGKVDWCFVQHESDISYPSRRLSYLSDEWLDLHREMMEYATSIGVVTLGIPESYENYKIEHIIYPLRYTSIETQKTKDIAVLCDSSYRKGAHRYKDIWEKGRYKTTIIGFSKSDDWPEEWDILGFGMNQYNEMLMEIAKHKLVIVPSLAETNPLALGEANLVSNTLVFSDDDWTQFMCGLTNRVPLSEANEFIDRYLDEGNFLPDKKLSTFWIKKARRCR